MKISTLIIATVSLLAISTASFAQTSFINLKSAVNNEVAATVGCIKFNPLGIADGVIKVKMFNQPKGAYIVRVVDADGKVLGVKEIQHANGTKIETAEFGKTFAGGTYNVEVISPDNTKTAQTIMLLI